MVYTGIFSKWEFTKTAKVGYFAAAINGTLGMLAKETTRNWANAISCRCNSNVTAPMPSSWNCGAWLRRPWTSHWMARARQWTPRVPGKRVLKEMNNQNVEMVLHQVTQDLSKIENI